MKKLISTLLAVAMLVSFIPAVSAEETTALEKSGVKVVYDLNGIISANSDNLKDSERYYSLANLDYQMTNGLFEFVDGGTTDAEGNKGGTKGIGGSFRVENVSGFGAFVALSSVSFLAVEVFVPESGSYDLEMYAPKTNYINTSANPPISAQNTVMNVYVSKEGVSTASSDLKGTYNTWEEYEGDQYVAIDAPKVVENIVFPEAGKYVITFKPNCKNWTYQTVGTFVLNGGDSFAPMITDISLGKTELSVGEQTDVSVNIAEYMSDGKTLAQDVTCSYETSDETVARVDENGKITGVSVGTATITATATKDNGSSSRTVDVLVSDPDMAKLNLTYNFSSLMIGWKETSPGFASLTYDKTNDLNAYYTNSAGHLGHHSDKEWFKGQQTDSTGAKRGLQLAYPNVWYAATIRVPVSGKYIASVDYAKYKSSTGYLGVYLLKKDSDLSSEEIEKCLTEETLLKLIYEVDSSATAVTWQDKPAELGMLDLSAGEYYVVFKQQGGNSYAWFGDFHLDGYGSDTAPIINACTSEKTTFEIDETSAITTNVRYITDGNAAEGVTYSYKSSDNDVAEVSADGTITAKAAGNATITVTATATNATLPGTRTIDVVVNSKEDKTITDAFTTTETAESYAPSVTAYVYKDGESEKLENTDTETYVTDNGNGTYTLSAPADADGYKFLYWVKGLSNAKKILGTSREITYRATKDKSLLVAVYENTADASEEKAEFYNANMQLIETNTTFALPELPVLAGYGKASAWVSDDMTEYTSGAAEAKKMGTTIFVAKYSDEASAEIAITATNATVNNANPVYGEKVTLTANADSEGNVFQYFTKNGEVVCLDRTYSFNAYETCEVVAVFGETAPVYTGNRRKIFLDTFDVAGKTGLMAEFIGFGGEVVEKGIMIGTNKMPMTTNKAQFTVIADEDGTYKGYAIVKDGESYILITDGEYTK